MKWALLTGTLSFAFRIPLPSSFRRQSYRIYNSEAPHDVDVKFGSSGESGVNWGGTDNDDNTEHHQQVQELLQKADEEYQETQRAEKWGKFANVSNIDVVLKDEQQKLQQINSQKQQMALSSGVNLEVLNPRESSDDLWDGNENIKIQSGGGSWLQQMDAELKSEWESLSDQSPAWMETTVSKGQIVARESLAGVRVGSAGGWTLEVFPGDFVVHRKYGIGRFEQTALRPKTKLNATELEAQRERRAEILKSQLKKMKRVTPTAIRKLQAVFGTANDTDPISNPQTTVLEIQYADVVVHVPVDRAYRLSRYRAGNAVVPPKLSKARGQAWQRARERVRESTLELAQDVLALYATRETLSRPPFDPAKEIEVQKFAESFKYEPTVDQLRCFDEIESDMVWKSRPMDRLVCGDVGFGKTEVALRAIYRCLVNGRQAALLAPTGVLAAQHYKNIVARMEPFNQSVAYLRGGMVSKAGLALRKEIADGKISLVVGTHALLNNDFANLGLLVIDEEQRFGVKQKERLKLVCQGVDVLTLSATPIPRTLQMSLSGLRDTSTIRSPPPMRKPTITYVQDYSEDMVQMAIEQELERGGQCYYVVPRISMLKEAQDTIQRLFPSIRVIQAHGRMPNPEDNVAEFAQGQYDVLLATTVIENGVDIPSVNTIIVQNSQAFGMSTLYQLRGRVGRSDCQAYAYMLHKPEAVTEQAAMRLQAIGELNELGSGFDVANRDLEIRGAGSLLGTEQSGVAARVGFDLYMRMLKKAIRQLRGLDLPLVARTNILLDKIADPSEFELPEDYVTLKSERRAQQTKARLAESTAALVTLTNDWKTQFGPLPAQLQKQLKTLHLHACTRRLGIDLVGSVGENIVLRSPGLRPRHWATILSLLPQGVGPAGLKVVFPERFTVTGQREEFVGGTKVNIDRLIKKEDPDEEDEGWDAMDEEEIEAMKDISLAMNMKEMKDWQQYPHFVVPSKGSVDSLLKVLLPVAKIVYEKQEDQAESARIAADLREKQEQIRKRQKANEKKRR